MRGITIFLLLLINLTCFAQTDVKAILDTVLIKTKETSLYVNTVNWDSLQKQVYLKAENATTIQDLKPAFETLLNGLRDHHGKIINAKNYSYIAWFTDNKNKRHIDNRKFDNEIWKVVNDTALKFEYKLLKGKIGYLKIVGIGPNVDVEKESKKIRESIITLHKQKVDKWIIDLRYNSGGNMNPMMAGIAPLVGNGIVGSIVTFKNEKLFDWEIKDANFIYGGYQAVTLPDNPKFKSDPKIAVLTSRWTVSSGEIVATAFKGRPNTKFFGETTGGYTTNDGWEIINDEVILVISTGIYCDRNGNVYEKNIPVDVEIPFEVIKETNKDACILEAIKWLKQK
jgi:C-terminal processing protease CtpA/Prc